MGAGRQVRRTSGVLLGFLLLALSGCVTGVSRPGAVPSYADFSGATASTWLGRYVRSQTLRYARTAPTAWPPGVEPGRFAGFRLISHGGEALAARLLLIERAERTLDLQYYIFNGDLSGSLVAERLLAAADRGVRIRILLDDVGARMGDTRIIRLAAHPNIELRLFNPLTIRNSLFSFASRVGEFGRINYRMHNKLMVADNQVMITGGRNIGDEYFGLQMLDFQDIDAIGIGEIGTRASVSFDEYWNSYQSVPIEDISPRRVEPEDLDRLRRQLVQLRSRPDWQRLQQLAWSDPFVSGVEKDTLVWYWGEFDWIYDPAAKADPTSTRAGVPFLGAELIARLDDMREELLIISPYFIPRGIGIESIAALRARGVRVAVLTNSLAATDVIAVHSSYAPYRRALLDAGVELWELRPLAGQQERASTFAGDSSASLHAKSYVYDRQRVFIGSINLDPRSMNLNTEAGVLVEQPELALETVALFERWTEPSHAFRVRLADDARLRWEGGTESARHEPDASWLRRLVSRIIALLPVESQM